LDSAGQGHYSVKNNIKITAKLNATLRHKNIEITHILVCNQNFDNQKSGIPKYQNRTYFFSRNP
jgi:hypothetical protein